MDFGLLIHNLIWLPVEQTTINEAKTLTYTVSTICNPVVKSISDKSINKGMKDK